MTTDRIMTTNEVAAALRCSRATVNAVALHHGIGHLITPRQRVYQPQDVERIRAIIATRRPGRPRKERLMPSQLHGEQGNSLLTNGGIQ